MRENELVENFRSTSIATAAKSLVIALIGYCRGPDLFGSSVKDFLFIEKNIIFSEFILG